MTSTTSESLRTPLGLGVCALVAVAPRPALAQAPAPDGGAEAPAQGAAEGPAEGTDEAARRLIRQGEQHFVQRRYQQALDAYRQAYDLTGTHGLLYMLARCHEELGQLEEAIDLFEKFLATEPPAEVRGKAAGALRLLRQRITESRLVLQVAPFGATVLVDGQVVGVAPVEPRTVSPGWHDVEVRHAGYVAGRQRVQVQGGREATVAIELTRRAPERARLTPWVWATAGAGAALAVGGTVAFLLGERDHAEARAGGDLTQRQAYALAVDGDDKKTAGAVLWVGALAAGGAAVVMALVDRAGDAETRATTGVTAAAWPAGGAVVVHGRFW